jgi:circadian clock protein KaiC
VTEERAGTGVKGLDEMLGGGFVPGSMILVRGAPGTGKTCLALQYLIHGASKQNEPGLLISFEEFPSSLYRDAKSLGWDLAKLEAEGKLHMQFTSPEVFLTGLESPESQLNQLILTGGIRRLALDSVSHFDRLTSLEAELRPVYTGVTNGLRREGVTAMLLGEEGPSEYRRAFKGGLSFLVDAVVVLRHVEIESTMQRAVVVLKMRGSSHAKEIRRFEIGPKGLAVTDTFRGREGLLSGMPHRAPG